MATPHTSHSSTPTPGDWTDGVVSDRHERLGSMSPEPAKPRPQVWEEKTGWRVLKGHDLSRIGSKSLSLIPNRRFIHFPVRVPPVTRLLHLHTPTTTTTDQKDSLKERTGCLWECM